MANVSFLRGTQAGLDKLTSFTEGAFYLTTDSDRLYFAQSSTELVHLNHNVIHVDSISKLPPIAEATVGDFYYAIAENVLCTKSAGYAQWVQINKNTDTNDNTKVTNISDMSVTSDAQGITVSFNINQQTTSINNDTTDLEPIPVSFTIKSSDIATSNNINVGVDATSIENGVKIATKGAGSSGEGFNLVSGANTTITKSGNNVTISADDTTYQLTANDNKITLTDNNSSEQNIALTSNNDAITVAAASNQITVTHKDYGSKAAQSTTQAANPNHGESFTVIDSITTDKGHVTAFNTKTVTLPEDKDTTSKLSAEAGNIIRLSESNSDTSNVKLTSGADINLTTDPAKDEINIAHKTYASPSVTAAEGVSPGHGNSFTVVDSITASNGHITGYKTKTVTLPADNNTKVASVTTTANNEGKLSVTVTDTNGDGFTGTSGQVLYYTLNGEKIYNQGTLDVYTKGQVDQKIKDLNAVVYRGTVGGVDSTLVDLPTSGVQIGDTYMVAASGTYGTHDCQAGDLLIAIGTETNGVITSGLSWTYVPSGNDIDSQYRLDVSNNKITLHNTTSNDDAGNAIIAAGKDLSVSTSDKTISIAHNTFTTAKGTDTTAAPKAGQTVTVLDSITTSNGHVTGYTNKVITLPEDKDTTSSLSVESGNVIRLSESNSDHTDVTLQNSDGYISITGNSETDTLSFEHKSYGALNPTSGSNLSPNHGGSFTVVTGVSRDSGGHLSGYTTQKVTLPADNNTTSRLSAETGNIIKLTESDGDVSNVTLGATNADITLSTDTTTNKISIGHKVYSAPSVTAATAATPAHGGSFTVVDSITASNGHITGYKTKNVTLPADKDTTYSLSGAVSSVTNGAKFTTTLTGSDNDKTTSNFNIESTSLKVTAKNTTLMSVELEWGTF